VTKIPLESQVQELELQLAEYRDFVANKSAADARKGLSSDTWRPLAERRLEVRKAVYQTLKWLAANQDVVREVARRAKQEDKPNDTGKVDE
jgi:hypothetical protein